MKVAAGASYICVTTEMQPELKLRKKICSCKQTKISLNAPNALFDGSYLVNDIKFSIEESHFLWI